ncbi:MAG: carboxylesterase family protein [Aureliella sp.]
MKRLRLSARIVLYFWLLGSLPLALAQELTPQQQARILKRFPQIDRNGDGELSADELKPFRAQLEKAQKRLKQQAKPTNPKSKGPDPTLADLRYGDHKKTVMDVWLADSSEPTPVVVAIHGGGFTGGDKSKYHGCEELLECLKKGVSFVSINYRFRNQDSRGIRACLSDSARAIQFIRHHAKEWNIDKERLAAFGGSAGAGTSLWLACHDDLADPDSSDPVLRESTRLVVAGLNGTQATYDVLQWPDFIPSKIKWSKELAKARGADMTSAYGVKSMDELDAAEGKTIRKELDMLAWMSKDDPPIWMRNNQRGGPTDPLDKGHVNHHPAHVKRLKKRADEVGMKTIAIAPAIGIQPDQDVRMIDFFFDQLGVK